MDFNTFDIQEGKLGKPFKQTRLSRNTDKPEKWISGALKSHWLYLFKYIDGIGFFEVEIDYYGKIIKVNKDI